MRLVYKYRCYQHHEELMGLCKVSKNLYNQALYLVKTSLEQDNKFKFYAELEKVLKVTKNLENEVNYRLLKAQVAQQTIKIADQNIRVYIKAIKDWSKNPDKYKGKPELPHYIKKNGYFELVYPNQSCSIKKGKIWLSKTLAIDIPQYDKYKEVLKEFNQVRVLPREGYVEIEIVYSVEDKLNGGVDPDRYASIDLGLGNLATMVTDFSEPIIYSGRAIKSKNQYFNKCISKAKSQLDPNSKRKTSKKRYRDYGIKETHS